MFDRIIIRLKITNFAYKVFDQKIKNQVKCLLVSSLTHLEKQEKEEESSNFVEHWLRS